MIIKINKKISNNFSDTNLNKPGVEIFFSLCTVAKIPLLPNY